MNKTLLIAFLLLCFTAYRAAGQETSEPINTDRPDQSDGTYTLPENTFQIETGFIYSKEGGNYFLHNTMLRYGLTSKTEARLIVDYGRMQQETGILPAGLSMKQQIISQKGWVPDITAVGYIRLPFLSSPSFKPDKLPANLLLAFENEFSEKFSVGYNFGCFFDGESPAANWIFTLAAAIAPTEEISYFAEYFTQFSSPSVSNIDAGIAWLLADNLQIDLAAGTSLFRDDNDQSITTGISYRFE